MSLLPGIWRNVLENAKHRENFRVFEIGLEIQGAPAGSELPQEMPHLVAALYSRHGDGVAGLHCGIVHDLRRASLRRRSKDLRSNAGVADMTA